jgi:hypothetical protein
MSGGGGKPPPMRPGRPVAGLTPCSSVQWRLCSRTGWPPFRRGMIPGMTTTGQAGHVTSDAPDIGGVPLDAELGIDDDADSRVSAFNSSI